jgi:hypothetical protein
MSISGKPCPRCSVGWMMEMRTRIKGIWYIVYYCGVCQHAEYEPEGAAIVPD